jgi:hypothetical protein
LRHGTRRIVQSALGLALLTATVAAPATVVGAVDQHASCIGHEAAGISPPGSSDEFPGGVPEIHRLLESSGVRQGAVFSAVAKLHEGSHEACDAAAE